MCYAACTWWWWWYNGVVGEPKRVGSMWGGGVGGAWRNRYECSSGQRLQDGSLRSINMKIRDTERQSAGETERGRRKEVGGWKGEQKGARGSERYSMGAVINKTYWQHVLCGLSCQPSRVDGREIVHLSTCNQPSWMMLVYNVWWFADRACELRSTELGNRIYMFREKEREREGEEIEKLKPLYGAMHHMVEKLHGGSFNMLSSSSLTEFLLCCVVEDSGLFCCALINQ